MSTQAALAQEFARLDLAMPADVHAYRELVLSLPVDPAPYSDPFGLYSEELLAFFAEMGAPDPRRLPIARRAGGSMRRRKIAFKKANSKEKRFSCVTFQGPSQSSRSEGSSNPVKTLVGAQTISLHIA